MKKLLRLTALFSIGAILFTSCGKDGAVGPQGPAGIPGNANVQTGVFLNQSFTFVAANSDYELYLNYNAITQYVLDQGAVIVYFQTTSNTSGWTMLPATFAGAPVNTSYGLGQVEITDGTMPTGLFNFKVVVIPPAVMKAHPGVNFSNYSEVRNAFNIQN